MKKQRITKKFKTMLAMALENYYKQALSDSIKRGIAASKGKKNAK